MEQFNTTKASKDAYQGVARAGDHLADKADKVVDKVKAGANQLADKANDMDLAARYESIKESASEGYDSAISTVKKYPLYAVGGACAVGLLAGLLLARRR